jgi:hypothetical protein
VSAAKSDYNESSAEFYYIVGFGARRVKSPSRMGRGGGFVMLCITFVDGGS